MNTSKPRLAIVSSCNIGCALAYYADALKDFLMPAFDVEIVDLKTSELLRQDGDNFLKMSEAYIEQLCTRLREFDVVNVHLELGIFGQTIEHILPRIIKICQASGRLILTVHTIDHKAPHNVHIYQQIINSLKQRPASNPFHLIAHLPEERVLLERNYNLSNVSDFPLIFLTNERRRYFKQIRNPSVWKKQFGFQDGDITLGMFGFLSAHKNYLHALRTLNILPANYKLLVIGEAHHMNIKEWKVDPVVQEMISYLDEHPALNERVVFTGRREDSKYYEDLANIDFVLIPSYEVGQSGSASLSTGLEMSCAILKSNISNARGYETYYPNCFELFDVGNYYETKHKIVNFDKAKLDNLRKCLENYSEVQFRQMYLNIYETMKTAVPIDLSWKPITIKSVPGTNLVVRSLRKFLPSPLKSVLKKLKRSLVGV